MSLLILDINSYNSGSDNYQTFKTTLENLGLSVTINLFDTMADYNGTNPSPYGYSAVLITNTNKSSLNGTSTSYDQIDQNAQTILMDYLNNGGRLLFQSINISNYFNINIETSWGELYKAIYSVNNGAPWSTSRRNAIGGYLYLKEASPSEADNLIYNTQITIKQTNSSTILNNISNEFTWNPSNHEIPEGGIFTKNSALLGFENLKTNNNVLNSSELINFDESNITVPFILSNSYGKGQVLIANTIFGGGVNSPPGGRPSKFLRPILEPNIAKTIYNFVSLSDNEICFAAGTKIETDQGLYNIEELIPNQHTINNEEIIAVPRTVPSELNYLICFEKDALGENIPNEKTILTHNHKIEYEGVLVEALNFLFGKFENKVHRVEYNDEILYNVLLKKYTTIKANNLTAETLHPDNIISKKYLNNNNDLEKV